MTTNHTPIRETVPMAEKLAVMEALHAALRQRDELVAAMRRVAHVPCERSGNIHCTMIPVDAKQKDCPWCEIRAALAKVTP